MKIVETKISELNPARYNPRKISDKQMEDLKASLQRFGFVDPVIANKDMTIIGGHQRIKAWEMLGNDTVPVYFVDLDKRKEKELNIRLNKSGGEFDYDILSAEFSNDSLLAWGFEGFELGLDISDILDDVPVDIENTSEKEDMKENCQICPKCKYVFQND